VNLISTETSGALGPCGGRQHVLLVAAVGGAAREWCMEEYWACVAQGQDISRSGWGLPASKFTKIEAPPFTE
jgi:hypothetical protein